MTTDDADRQRQLSERLDGLPVIDREEYRRRSRRRFLTWGGAAAAGYFGFWSVQNRPRNDRIPDVLREGLELNEGLWTELGDQDRLDRTFSIEDREDIRENGNRGLDDPLDADTWSIQVLGMNGELVDTIGLDQVQAHSTHDMVWEHKCIEGWSNIVHWTGARFSEFAEPYYAEGVVPRDHRYVSLRTPDEEYYVGLDRETVMHPQTLLAWALNGEPLTEGHGAPLRLATPVTYGIKQLKRIGTIEFTDERPADFWAERGYDWYARL